MGDNLLNNYTNHDYLVTYKLTGLLIAPKSQGLVISEARALTPIATNYPSRSMWSHETHHDINILRCPGIEKSSTAVEQAFVQLEEFINEAPEADWLVDLIGISTVSSIAVARLIAIVRRVDMNNGCIAMINVHSFVSSVLTTMRIIKVLSLFEDEAAALRYLAEQRRLKSE